MHSIAQVHHLPERAGVIVFVSGEVVARDSAGSGRRLRRRSAVNVGDTLFTAPGAITQLPMVDAALISLKESTQFQIVAHEHNENPVTDESSIKLVAGGFRTITGAIGEQNQENYEASISNFATIGIRGTDYEVVITPQGEVITGVYAGGITGGSDDDNGTSANTDNSSGGTGSADGASTDNFGDDNYSGSNDNNSDAGGNNGNAGGNGNSNNDNSNNAGNGKSSNGSHNIDDAGTTGGDSTDGTVDRSSSGNGNSGNGNNGSTSNAVLLDASDVDFSSLSTIQRIQLASIGLTSSSPQAQVDISDPLSICWQASASALCQRSEQLIIRPLFRQPRNAVFPGANGMLPSMTTEL